MSRINIVREIKTKSSTQRAAMNNEYNQQREKGWDERFFLGKIPTKTQKAQNVSHYTKSHGNAHKQKAKRTHSQNNRTYTNMNIKAGINNDYFQKDEFEGGEGEFSNNYNNYNNNNNYIYSTTLDRENRLRHLWEELGVVDTFKQLFEEMSNGLEDNCKNELYEFEIENLWKLKETLNKMKREMQNREKARLLLQKFDQIIIQKYGNKTENLPENLYRDIIQTIKTLRIYSINTVNHINRIREIYSYNSINGKYNFQILQSNFSFDPYYLLKMQNDLNFLSHSSLRSIFPFAETGDPFLLAISDSIPIAPDIYKAIKHSQYLILHDIIFSRFSEISINEAQATSNFPSRNPSATNRTKKIQLEAKERAKDERNLLIRKMGEYDELTKFLENDRKRLGKVRNGNKIGNAQVDRDDERLNEIETDFDGEKEKKEIGRLKQLEEERKRELAKEKEIERMKENERIKEIKRKKEQEELMKKKKEKELQEIKRKEIEKIKREQEKKKQRKEEKEKEKEKEKDNAFNEIKQEENDEDEKEAEINEEIDDNEENEKQRKLEEQKKKEKIKQKVKEEKEEKEEKGKVNEKKDKDKEKENQKRKNKFDINENSLNNSLQRSMTPETRTKKLQENFKLNIFNGNLKDFINTYKSYYPTIPQNQKDIFNLKENPLLSITPYYNPKILICSNLSSPSQMQGLCIFYFDLSLPSTPKIIISHLSTSNQKDPMNIDTILLLLIDFLKENVDCIEIYIDLYYKYNEQENKFTIDIELRDLFKKTLLFKWVKLENLSNHIRYQKMLLKLQKTKEEIKYEEESILNITQSLITSIAINNKEDNTKKIKPKNIMNINSCYLVGLFKEKEEREIYDKYMNLFSFSFLLNKLKSSKNYTITSVNEEEKKMINWNLEEKDFLSKKTKFIFNKDIKEIESKFHININHIYYQKANYISSLNLSIRPLISSNISSVINSVHYNRIEKDINVLYYKDESNILYLIPSQEESTSIIIGKMTPPLRKIFTDSEENIYSLFNSEFYPNLKYKEQNDNIVLWVPSFSIDTHLSSGTLFNLEGIEISKDNNKEYINIIDEYMKVKFAYDKQREFSFTIDPDDSDIIIKEDFLFGLVNVDILSSFNMSCILLLHINRDNIIKDNKY